MKTLKQNLFGYITIAICAGIMIYFVVATGGIGALSTIFQNMSPLWLILAFGAAAMVWVMEAASFHTISTHIYRGWKFNYSFSASMVGLLYCCITPFSTGGQPMQIYSLQKKGMTTGAASAIVAVRSLIYQLALVVFSIVMVILRLSYFTEMTGFAVLLLAGLVCNLTYVSFLILLMKSPRTTDRIVRFGVNLFAKLRLCRDPEGRYDKIHAQLALFHRNITMLGRSLKMYLAAFFFSFFQFVFQCLIPYFLYMACFASPVFDAGRADFLTVMAAQAFVLMVSYFIPTPGAAGGAEVSYYGFFETVYQQAVAAAPNAAISMGDITSLLSGTMFLWRFISFYLTIIAGGIFVPISDRQKRLKLENKLFDEEALREAESHHDDAVVK